MAKTLRSGHSYAARARKKAPGGRECQKVVGEPAPAWRAASMTQGTPPAVPDTVNLYHVVHPSFTAHCRLGAGGRSLTPNHCRTRCGRQRTPPPDVRGEGPPASLAH